MKRCPACDKTFDDKMKFCQIDGTLLVEDAAPADPYKTVVGNQSDIASAIPPVDPFKTMVAPPLSKADDLLELPDDNMKTMVVSPEEMDAEIKAADKGSAPPLDLPKTPAAPSAPLIEPKRAGEASTPPKPKEPSLSPPSFGDLGGQSSSEKPSSSPFDSKPVSNDFTSQSPYGSPDNKPIPSPFQDSLPPGGFQPPSNSPFEPPPAPTFQEPESPFGSSAPSNSPFEPPSPFGDPFNTPAQQSDWTPAPPVDSGWGNQNQDLNVNQQFTPPPPAGGQGQNQTLAIVSLVCGILSCLCCVSVITGPAAIVMGVMAKNKAAAEPLNYGGSGLAMGGIITGAVGTLIGILLILLQVLGAFAGRF